MAKVRPETVISIPKESDENQNFDLGGEKEKNGYGSGLSYYLWYLWIYIVGVTYGFKWIFYQKLTRHRKLNFDELPIRSKGERLNVVLTGGNRGIGAKVLKQCLQLNMHVILGCRVPANGAALVEKYGRKGIKTGSVEIYPLDLNSLESVKGFARIILDRKIPINLLINNAAVMFSPFELTVDGHEAQFQTNYLSHFLLTMLLVPALEMGGKPEAPSRVVNVASVLHYMGQVDLDNIDLKHHYSPHMSYMSSKLLQVMSTIDLNRRFEEEKRNIRVFSVHPGVIRTKLFRHIWFNKLLGPFFFVFKTTKQGADAIMFVALSPTLDEKGGSFYINCKEHKVNTLALDETMQKELFDLSMSMCGLKPEKY